MTFTNLLGQTKVGVRQRLIPTESLLLDSYTDVIGAYSLRKLKASWTGNAILVRRSLDNAESTIGFDSNGELDTTSLLSFSKPTITGYLLDQYIGSLVGFSMRKISATYSGSVIRVRRSSDNQESDIGFNASGDLDTDSLLRFNENATTSILDTYSVSAGAWSLRKLSSTYSGSSIRVRRTSDSQESDIGFDVSGNLDTVTLLQFVGSDSARVTKIYDQSGNGRDFVQPTASWQPYIVNQGSLKTLNGKPAILFDTTLSPSNHFTVPNSTSTFKFLHDGTNSFVNYVGSFGLTSNPGTSYTIIDNGGAGSKNTGFGFYYVDNNGYNDAMNISISRSVPGVGNAATHTLSMNTSNLYSSPMVQHIFSILVDADNATGSQRAKLYRAGANEFAGNTNTNAPSTANSTFDLHLGAYLYDGVRYDYLNGNFQELVIFSSDQVSTRVAITSNVNYYYSNYTSSNSSFVKTWYDQSGNGRNATQTASANQPQIVSNGAILLQGGKPSIKYDGVNDYMNISSFTASVKTIFALFQQNIVDNYDGVVTARPSGETSLTTASDERSGFTYNNSSTVIDSFNSTSFFINISQTNTTESLNGLNYAQYIKTNSLSGVKNFVIGADVNSSTNRWLNGSVNELIMYSTDMTLNRSSFIGNTNTYYNWSIFPNNGYVKTWYDQSGFGRHATQTTAASQPQIVSNNSLITENSKPFIKYDGSNDYFVIPTFSDKIQTIFALFKKDTTNFSTYNGIITARDSSSTLIGNSNERVGFTGIPGNSNITGFENTTSVWTNGSVRDVVSYRNYNSGQSLPYKIDLNLVTQFATSSVVGTKNIALGADVLGSRYLSGAIREIMLYSSDQSSNRVSIENNINSYYSVWDNIVTTGLSLNLDVNKLSSYPRTGTSWNDMAGSNNGTMMNSVGYTASNGGGLTFNGTNQYVDFGQNKFKVDNFTMEIVFKINQAPTIPGGCNSPQYGIIGQQDWGYTLRMFTDGKATFQVFDVSGGSVGVKTQNSIVGNIAHITVKKNGLAVSIYLNGVLQNTSNLTNSSVRWYHTTWPFQIGNGQCGMGNYYMNGTVYLARFYTTILTDSEILQNFNATKTRFGL